MRLEQLELPLDPENLPVCLLGWRCDGHPNLWSHEDGTRIEMRGGAPGDLEARRNKGSWRVVRDFAEALEMRETT